MELLLQVAAHGGGCSGRAATGEVVDLNSAGYWAEFFPFLPRFLIGRVS